MAYVIALCDPDGTPALYLRPLDKVLVSRALDGGPVPDPWTEDIAEAHRYETSGAARPAMAAFRVTFPDGRAELIEVA
jgi:hypothetical protein